MTQPLAVIGSTDPWEGGRALPAAECVLAPNPSAMTLDGTNTWVLGRSGAAVIVDPGPHDRGHLDAVRRCLDGRDLSPALILLTHGHADHSAGAELFHEEFRVPVAALDPTHRFGSQGLHAGQTIGVGEIELRVIDTPGHTSDSLSFLLEDGGGLLTGDTILGRGTTVVAWPDGSLRQYLESLDRLEQICAVEPVQRVLPGHGPPAAQPGVLLSQYQEHRRQRLDQVRDAVQSGARSAADIVAAVYEPLPPGVYPAALASARAQWEYLQQLGEVPAQQGSAQ
jgi:glyoxylase-like metal-dependent hydrolase (beta-lactamase superfamily II)